MYSRYGLSALWKKKKGWDSGCRIQLCGLIKSLLLPFPLLLPQVQTPGIFDYLPSILQLKSTDYFTHVVLDGPFG